MAMQENEETERKERIHTQKKAGEDCYRIVCLIHRQNH
jgi:hypothetical protein